MRDRDLGRAENDVLGRGFTKEAYLLFGDLLLSPERYAVRVNEDVAIQERDLCITVRWNFSFPEELRPKSPADAVNTRILIPLLTVRKDAMIDGLELLPVNGRQVDAWSQWETKGLLVYVLRTLFLAAYTRPPAQLTLFPPLDDTQENALAVIFELVASTTPCHQYEVQRVAAELDRLQATIVNAAAAERLRRLCQLLADHSVAVIEVPFDNRLTVGYRRTVPPSQRVRPRRLNRRLAGLRPTDFMVPINLAFVSPSYHFAISGIPGQYVEDEYLYNLDTKARIDPEDEHVADMGGEIMPRLASAHSSAHLYLRNFQLVDRLRLAAVVEFAEVPPGALGSSVLVSLVTSALIGLFALGWAHPDSSGAPVLLFALPAAAAAWPGINPGSESLLRCSFAARGGLLASAVYAVAAAFLYLGGLPEHALTVSFAGEYLKMHVLTPAWGLLLLAAVATTGYLLWTYSVRFQTYLRAINTPAGSSTTVRNVTRLTEARE
jgi:hypothetical protein